MVRSCIGRLFAAAVLAGCMTIFLVQAAPDRVALAVPPAAPAFACRFDATCPEIAVINDPVATLGASPAPFRGYGDPSIERDPATGDLWMEYSWLDTLVDSPGPPPVLTRGVQTHLARSHDGGATFTFVRDVNTATPLTHPDTGLAGWSVHEIPTLLATPSLQWESLWLTYFAPQGDLPPGPTDGHSDFYYTRSTATTPDTIGDVSEPWADGTATSPSFGVPHDLSLIPELSDCAAFTEPALFARDGTTYLATNCVVFVAGVRRPDLERLVLLREDPDGYAYVGTLLTASDASAIGASRIEQADLSLSRSGAVLLIVTPIEETSPEHLGCMVYQVTDLPTASVLRDTDGHAIPLATITGDPEDAVIGAGQCTYDAASATGVIIVMHRVDSAIQYSLHATGIHPDVPPSVGGVAAVTAIGRPSGRSHWTEAILLAALATVSAALPLSRARTRSTS